MINKNVYIVEDMGITRATISSILSRNDYNVIGSSASAEKAWIQINALPVNLVILDINLKGENDGIWLAHKLREECKIPIVFLTAYGSRELIEKLDDVKPDGYIMKPFNNATLLGTVQIAIANYKDPIPLESTQKSNKVFIKSSTGTYQVDCDTILYLQSDGNYVNVFLEDNLIISRSKLDDMLEHLSCKTILKIHRRYAANIDKVIKITRSQIYISEVRLPISKTHFPKLKNLFTIVTED